MVKLRPKISGVFRSKDGANGFVVIRSVFSSSQKQGWNMLQTLNATLGRLMANIRLARSPPQIFGL